MNFKQLFADEDAVSPVIGVILMVAITVILAAVIGTFVLGLGENVQDSAPQANFQFEYENVTYTVGTGDTDVDALTATVTHTGGEDIDASNVEIQINGDLAYDVDDSATGANGKPVEPFASGTISTGSDATIAFYNTGSGTVTTGDANIGASGTPAIFSSTEGTVTASQLSGGETIRVVWTSSSGGSSNTIGQSTVPN